MSVRLDQVPAPASRPARPRVWLWLGLLPLLWLLGFGLMFGFASQSLRQQPLDFYGLALGVPFLGWCVMSFGRALLYIGGQAVADGWDEAREEDSVRRLRRGRRSQQVLNVSLYTALRAPGEESQVQLDALLSGVKALKTQPSLSGGDAVRQSRLPGNTTPASEHVLLSILVQVLVDLAQTLGQLPDETPLALLLEVDSGLPEHTLRRVWRQAWTESGIRQSTTPVEGQGLAALDQWLDQRIADQALLMVVAAQFAPEQPEETAEAVVGLLLGNRLTQTTLPPIAYLHRPEQEREPSPDALLYATRQALDWVPLDAESIEHVWRVGGNAQREVAISTVLAQLPMAVTHNLDTLLGHPGTASAWLAIVAATQTLQRGVGPQFIFSGDDVAAGLWCTVLTPVSPLSK
ncbi:hypothetical protein [Pseudomonas monachiensis]|uniref:Type VI secretion protein n=1 Tax=Pseudomonas monachiensis TaxID=3060212 RepID=A0ABW9HC97_9PSED